MKVKKYSIFIITLVFLLVGAALTNASPAKHWDNTTNNQIDNLEFNTGKIISKNLSLAPGDPVNFDAAQSAGADYLRKMQADITEDNAGNGTDGVDESPDDPDDGGWDWVLSTFSHTTSASPTNIYGATVQGVYYTYLETGDAALFTVMQDAADQMVSTGPSINRSGSDMKFLMLFNDLYSAEVAPTTVYSDAAKAKYDGRITVYGTATALAEYIRDVRGVTQNYPNGIIGWDIGIYSVIAQMLYDRYGGSYDTDADDIAEVLWQDSFNGSPGLFDIVADAGFDPTWTDRNFWWYTLGLTGLIDAFDASGSHIAEIPGLVTKLMESQYSGGGISGSYGANTDDEDWQSTGYAMMSLGTLDQATYQAELNRMGYWLGATQDVSGGWVYGSGNHYPEVAGECTSGLYFTSNVNADVIVDATFTSQADVDVYNTANSTSYVWGYNAFATIQEGIDAVNGSTISISAGTYYETLNITTAGLNIVGVDRATVIIDPTGLATNNAGIYVAANNVTIQSLTLRSTVTTSLPRYGIKFGTVDGCVLEDVTVRDVYRSGVDALGSSNLTISNVSILDNGGHGLSLVDCNNVAVTDITLSGNGWQNVSVATWGRYTTLGTSGIVFNGTNSFGDLFQLELGDYNNPGVPPAGAAIITYSTNILDGADVTVQASDFGFALHGEQDDSPGQARIWFFSTLVNAAIIPTLAPIGHWNGNDLYIESLTDGTQLYVTPGCSIQAAIDAADSDDIINVGAGTFVEALLINKPLTLRGATAGVNKNGYTVPAGYAWDDAVETIIMHPNPAGGYVTIVDIYDTDDVTFDGFIVQEVNAVSNLNTSLIRVYAYSKVISNINVINNIIGPNTNTVSQDGTHGRMGLYLVNHPYSDNGITSSTFAGNKIFDCKGNGDNIFLWSSYYAYGATGPASMAGTVIEDNEIYGAHRSGIETAGGYADLVIRNNQIYGNSELPGDVVAKLKYGHGIQIIRGSSDKVSDPLTAFGPVNLTIEANNIYDNSKCGIYMGPKNDQISIIDNTIHNNGWDGVMLDLAGNYWNPQFESPPVSEQYACYDCANDVSAFHNSIYDNGTAGNVDALFGVHVNGTPTNAFVFDAEENYWGTISAMGVAASVDGDVDNDPWCSDATHTNCTLTAPVTETWVDVSWAGSAEGADLGGGMIFGYNAFASVQAGIDGVNGSTVNVAAGTYQEQIHITTNDLNLVGSGVDVTIIQSPATLTEFFVTTTNNNYPIIFVDGATNVSISGLTIDGNGVGNANYRFIGLGFWNGGGSIINGKVVNIMNTPFSGAQHGVGVYSYNNTGGPYTIVMNNVLVDAFQKTAVALLGNGLIVDVDNVTTIGIGPTGVTAQNGIQIGGGVTGTLDDCIISDIVYTGGTWTATGFLNVGDVTATGIQIDACQTSVYWIDGSGTFDGGTITNPTGDAFYAYNSTTAKSAGPKLLPDIFDPELSRHTLKAIQSVVLSNSTVTGTGATDSWGVSAFSTSTDVVNFTVTGCTIDNWDYGIYAYDYGGPVNSVINGNAVINCNYGMAASATLTIQNASGNWWSTSDAATVSGLMDGPVDYTPWLGGGVSTSPGFDGDFSTLYVDDNSPQSGSSTRIQEGIDLVTGSTVNVMDGSYGADPVTGRGAYITTDGLNLIGESQAGTIIDGAIDGVGSSGSYWPKGIHIQANNVTVQNFTVQGFTGDLLNTGGYGVLHRDYAHDTPAEGYIFYDGCTVDNVTVHSCYSVVYALCFTNLTVSDCNLHDNYSDGMFIARGSDGAVVHDNVVTNSGDHGIWVGIDWSGLAPSHNAIIYNNTVNGAREGGISFVGSNGAEIYGNSITNVASEGWAVGALSLKDGPTNVNAYDNIIFNNDGTWNGYSGLGHGVGIDGGAVNINLYNNAIFGNTGMGVYNNTAKSASGKWENRLIEDELPSTSKQTISGSPNLSSSATVVMAENNYWGSLDGPLDNIGTNEATISTCFDVSTMINIVDELGNGLGNGVNENIDYCPWVSTDLMMSPDDIVYLCGGSTVDIDVALSPSVINMKSMSVRIKYPASLSVSSVTLADANFAMAPLFVWDNASGYDSAQVDMFVQSGFLDGSADLFTLSLAGSDDICTGDMISMVRGVWKAGLSNDEIVAALPSALSISADCDDPVVTINGPADGGYYNNSPLLDIETSDNCDIDFLYYQVDSDGWMVILSSYSGNSYTNATWQLPTLDFDNLTEVSHCIQFKVVDDLGREGLSTSWCFNKDITAPAAPTNLVAEPGHNKVKLSWTNSTSADDIGVKIQRNGWGDYPVFGTAAPDYPADENTGTNVFDGTGVDLVDVTGLSNNTRDVYYYTIFAYDAAGNYSASVTSAQARATSYWLGDIADNSFNFGLFDGYVHVGDLTVFASTYWKATGDVGYVADANFGPTVGGTDNGILNAARGIPVPDDSVQFTDLGIFAINYQTVDNVMKAVPLFADRSSSGILGLSIEPELKDNEIIYHLSLNNNADNVKLIHVVFEHSSDLKFKGFENKLESEVNGYPIFAKAREINNHIEYDFALIGQNASIGGSGELASFRFEITNNADANIQFVEGLIFDINIEELSSELYTGKLLDVPSTYELSQNYPNPFNPSTEIAYQLPKGGDVTLSIYNMLGQRVATLVDKYQDAGHYTVDWNGRNTNGEEIASGVYFYRLDVNDFGNTRKMVMIK